ncbi:alpha/beta fold hydrolase [Reichenbachiella ulvae]|uniref:Alpha/beta hydrolase n=1 Tax=Reichenbachiella ulvae TaxID=2980104 RepID=A0ABT3CRL8_9BACT|nr:alpha/beta hydrolase [Reichenbachiella ulvae]MCV9386350.1 alpha/beta hydrolase [Reichenbachiella ulvae]
MPYLDINNTRVYYEEYGIGPDTLLFCHGIFLSSMVFKAQMDYFKARYRCIVLDLRGQGQSDAVEEAFELEQLVLDVAEFIRGLQAGPCHFIGLSVGANIGMQLAKEHRELIKSLVLINANADAERSKWRLGWQSLLIKLFGVKLIVNRLMKQLFSARFLVDELRSEEVQHLKSEIIKSKRRPVELLRAYMNRSSLQPLLGELDMPTLIIAGERDLITPSDQSKNIKLKIPQARLAVIKEAGHCAPVEESWQVVNTMEVFLNGVH